MARNPLDPLSVDPPDERSVFINIPYDRTYEDNFTALLTGLISLGRVPRAALELPERGEGRLDRLFKRVEACKASIHDLSRVGNPGRFNMPFELGLAFALRRYQAQNDYHVVVFAESSHLDETLSDLRSQDPYIHDGDPYKVLIRLLEAFGAPGVDPSPEALEANRQELSRVADRLREVYREETIFTTVIFRQLVAAATEIAVDSGLLAR